MPITYITHHSSPGSLTTGEPYKHWTEKHENAFPGAVVAVIKQTVQVMSDIWEDHTSAVVWDVEKNEIRQLFLYGSEGMKEDEVGSAIVDATPETLESVRKYLVKKNYDSYLMSAIRKAEDDASYPAKGKLVKVVSGRTCLCAVGKVIVVMQKPYRMGWRSTMMNKLGVATTDRTAKVTINGRTYNNYVDMVWVWARNCEVINPEQYVDVAAIEQLARDYSVSNTESTLKSWAAGWWNR